MTVESSTGRGSARVARSGALVLWGNGHNGPIARLEPTVPQRVGRSRDILDGMYCDGNAPDRSVFDLEPVEPVDELSRLLRENARLRIERDAYLDEVLRLQRALAANDVKPRGSSAR